MEQKLGTGALLAMLKKDEVDLIVALTEGLVSGSSLLSPLIEPVLFCLTRSDGNLNAQLSAKEKTCDYSERLWSHRCAGPLVPERIPVSSQLLISAARLFSPRIYALPQSVDWVDFLNLHCILSPVQF